jgi:hypothetical protein
LTGDECAGRGGGGFCSSIVVVVVVTIIADTVVVVDDDDDDDDDGDVCQSYVNIVANGNTKQNTNGFLPPEKKQFAR